MPSSRDPCQVLDPQLDMRILTRIVPQSFLCSQPALCSALANLLLRYASTACIQTSQSPLRLPHKPSITWNEPTASWMWQTKLASAFHSMEEFSASRAKFQAEESDLDAHIDTAFNSCSLFMSFLLSARCCAQRRVAYLCLCEGFVSVA
jgi:hypothetical protein